MYDLPWYAFIGAPGSGKTTALVNSGLKFPLEQRMGKGALRGVGGTRNCDWWFTDEAVFLDTAGRYTTQDSDASADSAAWSEFLKLLRQYRRRRPMNGIILTISAQDLMTLGPDGRTAHVSAARRRLDELNQELRVQLPVYVFVTKCDLVAGFSEYFGDLTAEGRAQVWGVTFSRQETMGGAGRQGARPELDALMVRLNERLYARLEEETDARRRTKVFGFPQQMAALAPAGERVRRRGLRVDAVRQADPAARRLFHERHAGRHADRPAAVVDWPPLRHGVRSGGAGRGGAGQGLLHREPAQAGLDRRIGRRRA